MNSMTGRLLMLLALLSAAPGTAAGEEAAKSSHDNAVKAAGGIVRR